MIEIRITEQAYFHSCLVFYVVCLPMRMTAEDDAQGGVFMIFWDQPQGWSIEATRFHDINVVIY